MPKQSWFEALPGYAWDTRLGSTGRYRVILPDGRLGAIVSAESLTKLVRELHDASATRFGLLAQDAVLGKITPADFQAAMMTELRHLYNASSALAVGGYNHMTSVEYGRNGQILRGEYRYLAGFAQAIANGDVSLAQADARARLYAGKAYSRFWAEHSLQQEQAGMDEERWITAEDERVCTTAVSFGDVLSGCRQLGEMGWVPIGTLPAPGAGLTPCLGSCRCTKEARRASTP
jgi:hypothetical protein